MARKIRIQRHKTGVEALKAIESNQTTSNDFSGEFGLTKFPDLSEARYSKKGKELPIDSIVSIQGFMYRKTGELCSMKGTTLYAKWEPIPTHSTKQTQGSHFEPESEPELAHTLHQSPSPEQINNPPRQEADFIEMSEHEARFGIGTWNYSIGALAYVDSRLCVLTGWTTDSHAEAIWAPIIQNSLFTNNRNNVSLDEHMSTQAENLRQQRDIVYEKKKRNRGIDRRATTGSLFLTIALLLAALYKVFFV